MVRKVSSAWRSEEQTPPKRVNLGFFLISRGIQHAEDAAVLEKKALKTKDLDTHKHAERAYLSAAYCFRTALDQKDTDDQRTEVDRRVKECVSRANHIHKQGGLDSIPQKDENDDNDGINDAAALKASSSDESVTIAPKPPKSASKKKKNPEASTSSTDSYVSIPTQTPSPQGSLKERSQSSNSSKKKTGVNVKAKVDIEVSDKSSSKGKASVQANQKPTLSPSSSVTMKSKSSSGKKVKSTSASSNSHSGSRRKGDVKVEVKDSSGNKQEISAPARKKSDTVSDVRIVIDIGPKEHCNNSDAKFKSVSGKDKKGRKRWPF